MTKKRFPDAGSGVINVFFLRVEQFYARRRAAGRRLLVAERLDAERLREAVDRDAAAMVFFLLFCFFNFCSGLPEKRS